MKELAGINFDSTFISDLEDSTSQQAQKIPLSKIKLNPVFENLLPIRESNLENITQSIKETGFDETKAVDYWIEGDCLIDGHTRFKAAKNAGLFDISVFYHSFKTEKEALEYAIKTQLFRRNLDDAGLFIAFQKLDQIREKGRPSKADNVEEPKGKSSVQTAQILNVSSRKVEKMRAINNSGDKELIEKVEKGELSVNKGAKIVTQKKHKKTENNSFDDKSDALEDNSGNPAGLSFNHHEERPYVKPGTEDSDSQTDRLVMEVRKARIEECSRSFLLGVYFSISEIIKGSDENTSIREVAKEIVNFDLIKNFSSVNLNFKMPEDDILILNSIGIKTEQIKSLKSV